MSQLENVTLDGEQNIMSLEYHVPVLNNGYVRYIKHMGNDLDPVNSAKASFNKESSSFEEREARLLAFLIREEHTAVFRHSAITVEMYAPLMIARQIWKYVVASTHLDDQNGWSESSRRYITENTEFYLPQPGEWRTAPENKKQGSGQPLPQWPYPTDLYWDRGEEEQVKYGDYWTDKLADLQIAGAEAYEDAIAAGIAPEQARLFLPAYGLMVRWRWTFSLGAGLHFLHQRLAHDAQSEIREYAEAVKTILAEHFPNAVASTLENI